MKVAAARQLKKTIDQAMGERVYTRVEVAVFTADSATVEVYEGAGVASAPGGLVITYWETDEYSLHELCELL